MGKYDDAIYDYMNDPSRFADFFNGVLFQGERVIYAQMLEPDSERYVKMQKGLDGKDPAGNRFRDLKKRLKTGDWLAITAVENQENVDYCMPLRMMEYDCLEYMKQLKQLKGRMKRQLKESGRDAGAWNLRLGKEDKLHSVYSVCLYHGTREWDGPRSLRDIMDFENAPPGWKELFHDYGMTLFCANQVEDFSVFKTELRQFLEVIPCREDKSKLERLFDREEYRHLDRDTAQTIAVFTNNTKMLNMLEEEREDYDMCKALEDLVADGKAEALLDNIRKLMRNMSLAAEQAMEILEVPAEEREELLAKL